MNIFILEDCLQRIEGFKKLFMGETLIIAHTYEEAAKLFDPCFDYDLIFLDHDMDGHETTGLTFVLRFEKSLKNKRVIIHSSNAIGAFEMLARLNNCIYMPYVDYKRLKTVISHRNK